RPDRTHVLLVLVPHPPCSRCGSADRLRRDGWASWLPGGGQRNDLARRSAPRSRPGRRHVPWNARHRKHRRQLPADGRRPAAGQPHARADVDCEPQPTLALLGIPDWF
ncbi:unnamed protein product, partial [Mycena citricolor]